MATSNGGISLRRRKEEKEGEEDVVVVEDNGGGAFEAPRFLIVRSGKAGGGLVDLGRFWLTGAKAKEFLQAPEGEAEGGGDGGLGPVPGDHRWVIIRSIVIQRIIGFLAKPLEWLGVVVEFFLNLLSQNDGFHGLFFNFLKGDILVPRRGSKTFISAIGHLDMRLDLHKFDSSLPLDEIMKDVVDSSQVWSRTLMDLCMMAAKLVYENANVVNFVVHEHWQMHFVEFYNCWNEYRKKNSTGVFIMCDKPEDANIILISFRGTEPFVAVDWITDLDYSWYQIPEMGRVHMGFLEALGLGTRDEVLTFSSHLQHGRNLKSQSIDTSAGHSGNGNHFRPESDPFIAKNKMNAYYTVKRKLKSLLEQHKHAKFIVTGHSLGGALAILLPAVLLYHREEELMKRLLGVYTFGQPRVGDEHLVKFMKVHICSPVPKYFRVVYCNDLVARLPYDDKTYLYKHFGPCLYYNSLFMERIVNEEPNKNFWRLRYIVPTYLNAVWELIRSLFMGYLYGQEYKETWFSILVRVFGLVGPGISAHGPANYVNSIRLDRGVLQVDSI